MYQSMRTLRMSQKKDLNQMELLPQEGTEKSSVTTSLPAASHDHAKTYQLPDIKKVLKESVLDFGESCTDLLARFDPITRSLRMCQTSFLETEADGSPEYLQTWPKSGLMSDGIVYQQVNLAHHTEEIESGYWLTPTTIQIKPTAERREKRKKYRESVGRKDCPGSLEEQVMTPKFWPTPTVGCVEGGEQSGRVEMTKNGGYILRKKNKPHMTYGAKLSDAILFEEKQKMWPTPRASGQENPETLIKRKGLKQAMQHNLTAAVQMWPTPTANEDACGKPTGKMQKMLGNHPDVRSEGVGTLNATWVEWLMGYPIGWTDIQDS